MKVATAGDAAAMGTALTAFLKIPIKTAEGDATNKWRLSETELLPGALAAGWTNHSERATLTSALAAIGVPKDQRNLIGRWSPDGSDDYVRTYRAAVRGLVARFVKTVAAGRSYEAFDEEGAYVQVQLRIVGQVGEEAAVEAAVFDLKGLAEDISKKMAATKELASPTEVASLSLVVPPGELEEEDLFKTKYLIVYTHNRRCSRLHLAGGCWRARQLSFACFKYIDQGPPPERHTMPSAAVAGQGGVGRWATRKVMRFKVDPTGC